MFNDCSNLSVSVRYPIPDGIIEWLDLTSPAFSVEPVCGKYTGEVMYNIIKFEDEQMLTMFRLKWA